MAGLGFGGLPDAVAPPHTATGEQDETLHEELLCKRERGELKVAVDVAEWECCLPSLPPSLFLGLLRPHTTCRRAWYTREAPWCIFWLIPDAEPERE